jgi:hypothetical protein
MSCYPVAEEITSICADYLVELRGFEPMAIAGVGSDKSREFHGRARSHLPPFITPNPARAGRVRLDQATNHGYRCRPIIRQGTYSSRTLNLIPSKGGRAWVAHS